MSLFLSVVLIFLWGNAFANDTKTLYLGAGVLSQNAGQLTNNSSGTSSLFTALYTQATLTAGFQLFSTLRLEPNISYTPLGIGGSEGGSRSTVLSFGTNLAWKPTFFEIKLGPGLMFYQIGGSGGTSVQNNGSSTSTFALPNTTSVAKLFYVNAGIGFFVGSFRLDLDSWVINLLSSRRAINLVATLSFGFI